MSDSRLFLSVSLALVGVMSVATGFGSYVTLRTSGAVGVAIFLILAVAGIALTFHIHKEEAK